MHALLFLALAGDAGARDLRKAVDVESPDGQGLFNLPAHLLGPGSAPEDANAQPQALGVDALFPHCLADVHGIAGGAGQDVGA